MRPSSWDRILLALVVAALIAMMGYAIIDLFRH